MIGSGKKFLVTKLESLHWLDIAHQQHSPPPWIVSSGHCSFLCHIRPLSCHLPPAKASIFSNPFLIEVKPFIFTTWEGGVDYIRYPEMAICHVIKQKYKQNVALNTVSSRSCQVSLVQSWFVFLETFLCVLCFNQTKRPSLGGGGGGASATKQRGSRRGQGGRALLLYLSRDYQRSSSLRLTKCWQTLWSD